MSEVLCAMLLATLSMHDAVSRAIAHSPDIRALEAQVAEARASATMADAFRPSASISSSPGYATGLPTAVLGQTPAIATIEAHKLIYDTSARAEQIGAQSQVDAAESRLESRKRDVAQNTAEIFARVAADARLAESARQRVEAYRTIASHIEDLGREGRARDIDVNRARLQLAGAERAALQAQSRLELDRLKLERLTGDADAEASFSPLDAAPPPATSFEAAQANDPELRSLEKRIVAIQSALSSENRLLKPTVAAQIQYSRLFDRYGRFYLNFKPDDLSAAATISLPIWTSGRRTAAVARINAQLQELIALRDSRKIELELSVREAETDLKQAEAERDLAGRTLSVAQEGLRIAEQLATEGRGEANDVPSARIALADAQDDVANGEAHVEAARARLLIVRGDPI